MMASPDNDADVAQGSGIVAAIQIKPAVVDNADNATVEAKWRKTPVQKNASGRDTYALLPRESGPTAADARALGNFQNEKAKELNALRFWVRDDGHCAAEAPQFNAKTGNDVPIEYDCDAAVDDGVRTDREGRLWREKVIIINSAQLTKTIQSLTIVFNEGDAYTYVDDSKLNDQVIGQPAPPLRRR